MKTTLTLLAVATALGLPFAASAQSGDVAYCKKLAAIYRAYNDGQDPPTDIALALNKCNGGAAGSIPVLEQALTSQGFTLPKK